jgi:hypothetical protein
VTTRSHAVLPHARRTTPSVVLVLNRLLEAAARLDRLVGPRLFAPLVRLERAAEVVSVHLLALALLLLRVARTALVDVALPLVVTLHRLAEQHALPPSARVPREPALRRRRWLRGRELALASVAVFLVGVGAASAGTSAPAPALAVPAAVQHHERSQIRLDDGVDAVPARPEARPAVPEPALVTPYEAPPPPVAEAPVAPPPPPPQPPPSTRWLPTGTGMWLHEFHRSEGGSAQAVVDRARASGLTHLYVQTGSTKKGWIGEEVLSQLLPATAGTDLKVIAWDFPKLIDPEADAQRMAAAATWSRPGVPRVAAVAPDVETAAEGTRLTPHAVLRYYRELRRQLPPEIAVLATVPWPSEKRIGSYPYAETAAHSDAFVPMAYWYNRAPSVVTETSMQYLGQFGLPVMPVGQGYDGRLDAPYLPEDPDPTASVQAFVDAARAGGAASVSLWSWQTMYPQAWDVLTRASAGPWTPALGRPVPVG